MYRALRYVLYMGESSIEQETSLMEGMMWCSMLGKLLEHI